MRSVLHCLPNIPATPAAKPPIIPVTKISRYALPPKGNKFAIFFASMKSLALPNQKARNIHNRAIAKKGTKNTAPPFKLINIADIKAANITDHQGKNCDKMSAIIIVKMKFKIFLFMVLVLSFELQ